MDYMKICRICLESNKQNYDIFSSYCTKRHILYYEMLTCCTKLQIFELDGLPRHICKDCCKQLKKTYAFNIQCEKSDKTLRESLPYQDSNHLKSDQDVINNIKEETVKQNETKENMGSEDHNHEFQQEIKLESENDDICNDNTWDEDDEIMLKDVHTKVEKGPPKSKIKKGRIKKDKGRINNRENNDDFTLNESTHPEENESKIKGLDKKKRRRIKDTEGAHQCDVCGKFLSTKSNLKAHKVCHTDARPYSCEHCAASFRGYSALYQHKKVHSGETPYHCEYCPKKFSRRTGLVNHIRMHMGEKLYSCDICFKAFVQRAQLSVHMKRHKGEKPFLCQACGKGFPIKSDLKVHQRIHNGEKPYSCQLCTKTFATSGNLSIHVRIHNKEIRYHCKICQRGFVTCSSYNLHVKRHKGQRDYHCECGKTFFTSSALKQHQVVHTGEKKYQCKICERKFTQTSHLTRHFKKDHAKANVSLPPTDHFKLVLSPAELIKDIFVYNSVPNSNGNVKCENN